jgi:hypothetical protein
MTQLFSLHSTYELLLELGNTLRPIRAEVFIGVENPTVFRARIWEQTTYNLYPTFANITKGEGPQNRLLSCDEINREITLMVADSPEFITGKQWVSEEEFVAHIKTLIFQYHKMLIGEPKP